MARLARAFVCTALRRGTEHLASPPWANSGRAFRGSVAGLYPVRIGAAWQRRARKAINGSTRNVEVACVPAGTGEGCRAVPDGWSRVGLTGPRYSEFAGNHGGKRVSYACKGGFDSRPRNQAYRPGEGRHHVVLRQEGALYPAIYPQPCKSTLR